MTMDHARTLPAGPRRSVELDSDEALRLLGSVSFGRIVFTRHALPTIRPVNHVLDNGDIVIRTHEGAALTSRARQTDGQGVVVAYEADAIDPDMHLGWSVMVTGYAHLVTEPGELAHYRALLNPWVNQTMDYAVRIRPDLITGIRLTADGTHRPGT
ncbi:pyridoxamine 5'-phosphate oxidase family protein [Streptomyces sp. NPDC057486]|uniref:pyridoxamine 5'-phosphate oxidase family protein n=1 Tax=Streptomyces sp. NPDC057486 TaxID=3346145 RepID=UPI0036B6DF2E